MKDWFSEGLITKLASPELITGEQAQNNFFVLIFSLQRFQQSEDNKREALVA